MSEDSEDQIHVATPARREEARRDGDIPKSFEMAAALQLIGALAAAYLLLGQVGQWLRSWTTETWSDAGSRLTLTSSEFSEQMQSTINASVSVLLPIMVVLFLIGIASHWLQTGPVFLSKKIVPTPSRLGPGNWKRQVFSLSSLAFLFVGIPKVAVAAAVLLTSSWFHRDEFFLLANSPADAMVAKMFSLILTIAFHVALALLVTSAADYWLKFASHQRQLRMTDQQLRDELRMQNGDPQTRVRQRQLRKNPV
jgi:flagellar biosynthetic protein FlhB